MTAYTSVDSIRKNVIECTKCSLCKDRKNSVPGKGDEQAKVMFVGEAPGRSEDEQGAPFVGAAGKILTQALQSAGIQRSSVYITNVVKCRPPANRVPTDEERKSCMPYLESEIALIGPRIVCVMGNTAFRSLLGGDSITKHRGSIIEKNGVSYFVTVHPAATIYNKKLLPVLEQDMQSIAKILDDHT